MATTGTGVQFGSDPNQASNYSGPPLAPGQGVFGGSTYNMMSAAPDGYDFGPDPNANPYYRAMGFGQSAAGSAQGNLSGQLSGLDAQASAARAAGNNPAWNPALANYSQANGALTGLSGTAGDLSGYAGRAQGNYLAGLQNMAANGNQVAQATQDQNVGNAGAAEMGLARSLHGSAGTRSAAVANAQNQAAQPLGPSGQMLQVLARQQALANMGQAYGAVGSLQNSAANAYGAQASQLAGQGAFNLGQTGNYQGMMDARGRAFDTMGTGFGTAQQDLNQNGYLNWYNNAAQATGLAQTVRQNDINATWAPLNGAIGAGSNIATGAATMSKTNPNKAGQ